MTTSWGGATAQAPSIPLPRRTRFVQSMCADTLVLPASPQSVRALPTARRVDGFATLCLVAAGGAAGWGESRVSECDDLGLRTVFDASGTLTRPGANCMTGDACGSQRWWTGRARSLDGRRQRTHDAQREDRTIFATHDRHYETIVMSRRKGTRTWPRIHGLFQYRWERPRFSTPRGAKI
jgi:hypothetical protein